MRNLTIFITLVFCIVSCKTEEPQNPPTVATKIASDIQLKGATLNGEVTDEGYSLTKERGFVFSTINSNPTLSDSKVTSGAGKGFFSIVLSDLKVNTQYYFRAFATNTQGTTFGATESFTTIDYKLPSTSLSVPQNVLYSSVLLNGSVTDEGGGAVSESGFVLSLNSNPTISDLKFPVSKGKATFALVVTKLSDNTKYYVRPYAINEKGISYGNELNFITKQQTVPTVSILNLISVDYFNCVLNFGFSDAGGSQITNYGICISESLNPTINDIVQSAGLAYSNILYSEPPSQARFVFQKLKLGTTYHARAFAKNSKGISYSIDFIFKTDSRDPLIGQNLYGGVIAYVLRVGDPGYDPNVKHGIVTAPVDIYGRLNGVLETGLLNYTNQLPVNNCYCSTDLSITTGQLIGDGKKNTSTITSTPCKLLKPPAYPYQSPVSTAAKVSDEIIINGFKDWFLPSLNELKELYKNRDVLVQMGGSQSYFWTSSYCGLNFAYAIQFSDYPVKPNGIECIDVTSGTLSSIIPDRRFRPVRYF